MNDKPLKIYIKKVNPIVKKFIPIAKMVTKTFGERCEVVIHDFKDPQHSIVAIYGSITGRKIGDGITDFALEVLRKGGYGGKKDNIIANYKAKTRDGRILKSSTYFIRNSKGKIIGCFCINYDLTEHIMFSNVLLEYCSTFDLDKDQPRSREELESFTSDVNELLKFVIQEAISKSGKPVSMMSKDDKLMVVKEVDEKGGFLIKGSINYLASELSVSRYTIYNYLDELKIRRS